MIRYSNLRYLSYIPYVGTYVPTGMVPTHMVPTCVRTKFGDLPGSGYLHCDMPVRQTLTLLFSLPPVPGRVAPQFSLLCFALWIDSHLKLKRRCGRKRKHDEWERSKVLVGWIGSDSLDLHKKHRKREITVIHTLSYSYELLRSLQIEDITAWRWRV